VQAGAVFTTPLNTRICGNQEKTIWRMQVYTNAQRERRSPHDSDQRPGTRREGFERDTINRSEPILRGHRMEHQILLRLLVETFNDLSEYRPARVKKLVERIKAAIASGDYTLSQAQADVRASGLTRDVLDELID
jgi:anti-sigma28 factor (negative regulator of flagellin synthesis)